MGLEQIGVKCCHACRHFRQHAASQVFDCSRQRIFFDYRERGAYYVCDKFSPFSEKDFDYGVSIPRDKEEE